MIVSSKTYRAIYEKYFGKIKNDMVIHHVDHNRENNKILNLICLDKKLHSRYHMLHNLVGQMKLCEICDPNYSYKYLDMANKYIETKNEIRKTELQHQKELYIKYSDVFPEMFMGKI